MYIYIYYKFIKYRIREEKYFKNFYCIILK